MKDVLPHMMDKWHKANAQFRPPMVLSEQSILAKLSSSWDLCSNILYNRANEKMKDKSSKILDRLFDILKCKCDVKLCDQSDCEGCDIGAHISCNCPRIQKIIPLELTFILAQRIKVGEHSTMQIAGVDIPETKRQEKYLKRKQIDEKRSKEVVNTENLEYNMTLEAEEDLTSPKEDESDEEVKFGRHKVGKRNLTQLDNIALASIRYGVDDRPTAAIVSATLVDFGVITKDDQQIGNTPFQDFTT